MGQKFVENDFFDDSGQKWKVNGYFNFCVCVVKSWLFNRGLTMAVFRSMAQCHGKRGDDDVCD